MRQQVELVPTKERSGLERYHKGTLIIISTVLLRYRVELEWVFIQPLSALD
jgi:hypothetical protein